jgi:hypothetical protein
MLGVLACDVQQSLLSSHMCAAAAPAEGVCVVVNMRVALNLSLLGLVYSVSVFLSAACISIQIVCNVSVPCQCVYGVVPIS